VKEKAMFDTVVIGIDDYVDGRDPVALARELVSGDGRLMLAYVQVVPIKPGPESGEATLSAKRQDALERLAALRDECNISGDVLTIESRSVTQGLREIVRDRDADLLVIGASRLEDLDRVFGDDHTRDVLKSPPCPVAVAPHDYFAKAQPLRRIGVGYDGSAAADRAIDVARELAAERGAELVAFEAVPEPVYVNDPWDEQRENEERVEQARRRLTALGDDVEVHAESGDAVEQLRGFERTVDLLVLGSHRYGAYDEMVGGSVAQLLADDTSGPLLVLKPDRRAAAQDGD
jgi:nucleotide-binding universal stress UspA family protein